MDSLVQEITLITSLNQSVVICPYFFSSGIFFMFQEAPRQGLAQFLANIKQPFFNFMAFYDMYLFSLEKANNNLAIISIP